MSTLTEIAFHLACLFGVLTLIGIIRPFMVLWWTKNHTRGKVVLIWGGLTALFSIIHFTSITQEPDTIKSNTSPKDSTFSNQSR